MKVQEIMTRDPACCSARTSLQSVAQMMAESDCGEIPVLDEKGRPIGVVTDRDICIRAVAQGRDTAKAQADEIMSTPVYTVRPEDSLDECCQLMETHQIRRLPVVDAHGICCGIVSQADVVAVLTSSQAAEVVRDISHPAGRMH
ncbi:MAG TPA: CBS domain-containing protein [Moraxellaceae bacterium]|nr:CBS domain-containing protein [Moraxellaceae bacterium]